MTTPTTSKLVRMDAELGERIAKAAAEEGRSENAVMVEALDRYTARREERVREAATRLATRDRALLDRLAQ